MTVKELRDKLQDLPDNAIVIMSKDAEGNNHSPLYDVYDEYVYVPDSTWSGDIYLAGRLTPELIKEGYTEEDFYEGDDGQEAVKLSPVN